MANAELVAYIQSHLAGGRTVTDVLTELKEAGWSDQAVNQAFRAALTEDKPDHNQHQKRAQHPAVHSNRIDTTQAVVIVGILLILAAAGIVISSQWLSVTPLVRILFVAIPNILLLAIAYFLHQDTERDVLYSGTLASGGLLIPFTVGTILYQTGIFKEVDAPLFAWSILAGLIFFKWAEFILKKEKLGPLTLVMMYSFIIWLMLLRPLDNRLITWTLTGVSLLITGFGIWLTRRKHPSAPTYTQAGILLSCFFTFIALEITLTRAFPDAKDLPTWIAASISPAYLAVAVLCQRWYKKYGNIHFYNCRSFLENFAPALLLLSFFILAITKAWSWDGSDKILSSIYALIGILLSFIYLFGSIYLPISSLVPLGAFGLVCGILLVTSNLFSTSLGWPVAVFCAGFAMLGLSYFIRRVKNLQSDHAGEFSLFDLATPPSTQVDEEGHEVVKFSIVRILGILVLIWMFTSLATPLIFLIGQRNYHSESGLTPTHIPNAPEEPTPDLTNMVPIISLDHGYEQTVTVGAGSTPLILYTGGVLSCSQQDHQPCSGTEDTSAPHHNVYKLDPVSVGTYTYNFTITPECGDYQECPSHVAAYKIVLIVVPAK